MKIEKISVVIPIYNELENIPYLIERLKKTLSLTKKKFELIFVDDNSTDDTKAFFESYKDKSITYLKKIGKKGKAYSLTQGFSHVTGDAIVMIDADLQYPPEYIPDMIDCLDSADIIVANRKKYKDSVLRKTLSTVFRLGFGKLLFGLDYDIQSGLKVFTKDVLKTVKFTPSSQWTFDVELLHIARHGGFKINSFDITFEKRKKGHSSVNVIKSTLEIGLNSLKIRAKKLQPLTVLPENDENMIGAGIRHKRKVYVTHTTLSHKISAFKTFTFSQKLIGFGFVAVLITGLIIRPMITLQVFVATLSFIYFLDVFFNLFLILRSLSSPQEISISDKEIENLKDEDLPVYTILCPLYKEGHIIPQFVNAINNLSYPKNKLDVILLLEEDDLASIKKVEELNLPSHIRSIIVPHSIPKTKPKACNYGLGFARGEYLVIFDAEDIPESMQLKKAILGFKKVPSNVICLQAKLNYYNPHQNLLTRFFTAEYSLWFDVTLTGLQSINTSIPLGGTSNHFRTKSLKEIEGWDPFNVTEDADLGIRLFRKGYQTAIIDSITLEEANSKYGNWLRQRSRWLKGYMQTYLVHVREAFTFTKEKGIHSLIFQLVVGGKIAFVLINPLLWIATIAYFTLYAFVGPQIESLYPSAVFYMAIISLVFGNFLFLYYYMIGVAKKGQWNLMKFVFFVPIYWIMISVAAVVALYQLIFKPHYWEKTIHGFHLDPNQKAEIATEIITEEAVNLSGNKSFAPFAFAKGLKNELLNRKHYLEGLIYVGLLGVASVFNFSYSAFLGRALNLEDFALISLVNGLLSVVSVVPSALGSAVTFKTGYLIGKYNESSAHNFWKTVRRKSLIISGVAVVLWILLTHELGEFFNTASALPFIFFSPVIFSILAYSIDRGFLSSRLSFIKLGILAIAEAVFKIAFAAVLVYLGYGSLAYLAIPLSIVGAFVVGWIFVITAKTKTEDVHTEAKSFPSQFFVASFISGLSSIVLLNLDVIMAKHFLSSKDAGIYSLAALIVKMIYFLGTFITPFLIPLVSRNEGAEKDSSKVLKYTLIGTFLMTFPGFVGIGLFGHQIAPFIFGEKATSILPYLLPMSVGIMCYSLARIFNDYYLTKKYYTFPIVALLIGAVQIFFIEDFHSSVGAFVTIMSVTWIAYFGVIFVLHVFSKKVKIIENNIVDFLDLFARVSEASIDEDKLRILILNWRDTKHVWAGGAEVYIQELGKRFVKDGNSVTIFSGNDSRNPRKETVDGIQIFRHGGFYTVYFWALIYYVFKFRGKFDVIIDCENGIPFFTPLYTKIPKFLLIHHVHQEVFRKSLKWPLSSIALFLEAKIMPFVYRNTQVITVSPSSKEEILRHKLTKKEPIIVYNGVDLERFVPAKKSENPQVLYLGRIQYYKSLHVFLVAAANVLKKIPDVKFVIAGEGEEKAKLIEFAQKLKISQSVKFLGKVTENEKISLMQKSWIFVNPSFMEGWGITTIEAAACATPTVASNVPGLKDAVKDNETGYLIRYSNYSGFTDAIVSLVQDTKKRNKLSKTAVAWAQNFSWDQSAEHFFSLLKSSNRRNKPKKSYSRTLEFVYSRIMSLF